MEPKILFENDDVVVVNKPYGMRVHNDNSDVTGETLTEWFLSRAPEARGVGEESFLNDGTPIERSGVVHRLDRDTSGVLIYAKHQAAFDHLKKQFHDRLAKKEYRAFVYGMMKEKWGTIDRAIGRSPSDPRKRSAQKGAKGVMRDAVTEWELIGQSYTHAYLKLRPKTGRMHQLRVHLKALDRPIVMDPLYAPDHHKETMDNLGFDHLALHSHYLEIELPHGEIERFIAPLPDMFEIAAEKLLEDQIEA